MNRPPHADQGQRQLPPSGNEPVSQYELRRHLGSVEQRLGEVLEGMQRKLATGEAQIADLIRSKPMTAVGGLGCGPSEVNQLGQAVIDGRVLPYMLSIDIPYDKDTEGVREVGQVVSTADGPVFITNLYAFAQINSKDTDAQYYPFSLIKPPSCNADCGSSAFDSSDEEATFELNFGSILIPGIDVRGAFIPLSPSACSLISPTATMLCATLTCPDDVITNYQALVPLVLLDHPECLSGVTEIKVGSCSWQNTQFPLALWDPGIGWDLTNEVPGCLGVGGYLDKEKILQVALTLTQESKFNVIVTFVFAGFRLVTCGTPVAT